MSEMTATMTAEETFNKDKTKLGFWVYVMTDCVLFASLFATYAVLHNNLNGGPSGQKLFDLSYVLKETLILLTSSFTCGLGIIAAKTKSKRNFYTLLIITFALGLTFVAMELHEFSHLYNAGDSWRRSGFLSGYFTLVATHGLHITVGLLWMLVMMIRVAQKGFTHTNIKRLELLSIFWHFLDLIWIFIFTIVYMFGAIRL